VMVHAREVRPLRFRSGITAAQLLDVVRRRGDRQLNGMCASMIAVLSVAKPNDCV
jgi:hypothetical protein